MLDNQTTALFSKMHRPKIVFSDFDGTLTNHTDFSPLFFDILSLVENHNTPLVIVTGRSVSWGHFLLTHFPSLQHIIAEGGGIHTFKKPDGSIEQKLLVDFAEVEKLSQISQGLLSQFPTLSLSADSTGRVSDRAIELDVLEADPALFSQIKDYLTQNGAHYSTSNVHLNFWCGRFDKYQAMSRWVREIYPEITLDECVFFGDSLNDQSVFQQMKHCIGVANIQSVEERLTHKPSIILRNPNHTGPAGVLFALIQLLNKPVD